MNKTRILCFGDSLTHGFDPDSFSRFPESSRWPMILQEILGDGYRIIEEGQGGRTIASDDPAEGEKNGSLYIVPCLESHAPLDLVIVMLGTNDCKKKFGLSSADVAGEMELFLQKVLSCGETRSSEENVKILKKVAVKVAESSEEEPSVVLSRMKEALQRSVYEKESFSPVSLAEDIFEEESSRRDFLERVRENSLPEEVEVPVQAVSRMAARQKIRTDNGIEISAPSEYFSDRNYVEIKHNPDGSINILLKQVGEIKSRL